VRKRLVALMEELAREWAQASVTKQ
jgi:hypothetical protein